MCPHDLTVSTGFAAMAAAWVAKLPGAVARKAKALMAESRCTRGSVEACLEVQGVGGGGAPAVPLRVWWLAARGIVDWRAFLFC